MLAGDPQQLGPVVRSPLAQKHGLRHSLLERLLTHNPLYKKGANGYNPQFITKLLCNYRLAMVISAPSPSHDPLPPHPGQAHWGLPPAPLLLRACALQKGCKPGWGRPPARPHHCDSLAVWLSKWPSPPAYLACEGRATVSQTLGCVWCGAQVKFGSSPRRSEKNRDSVVFH